jgi:hypothetical protein
VRGDGQVSASMEIDVDDSSMHGDIIFDRGQHRILTEFDSDVYGKINKIAYTKKSKGWMFQPTLHVADKKIDLVASANLLSPRTNLKVEVLANGTSSYELNHLMNDRTSIMLVENNKEGILYCEVSRLINSVNTIKPKLDLKTKHLSFQWVRKLSNQRSLSVNVDPGQSVNVALDSLNDNHVKVMFKTPWGNVHGSDIFFSKKLSF